MLVSDLIKFRDELSSKLSLLEVELAFKNSYDILESLLMQNSTVNSTVAQGKIHSSVLRYKELHEQSKNILSTIASAIDDINHDIDDLAVINLVKKDEYPLRHYNRHFTQSEEITNFIFERLRRYSDLRYPGMQLICESPQLTSEMVVNDPLYLCDFFADKIDNTCKQFNEIYNRRIVKYVMSNQLDQSFLLLPHNQFGFILCWMHFNYYELETLEIYLKSVIALLRPGGVFMFSYNNGDLLSSCLLTEHNGMSFIPKRKLTKVCTALGYEIINSFDMPNTDGGVKYISWIEIKKPGTLKTSKKSQSLGIIGRK